MLFPVGVIHCPEWAIEMSRRKGGVDLEVGMLEDIFGHTER